MSGNAFAETNQQTLYLYFGYCALLLAITLIHESDVVNVVHIVIYIYTYIYRSAALSDMLSAPVRKKIF